MRNLQQRVSEGPESAASPERSQSAMEAEAEDEQGGEEEGVCVPGTNVCPP